MSSLPRLLRESAQELLSSGRKAPLREMYPRRTPIVSSSIVARRVTNLLTAAPPLPSPYFLGLSTCPGLMEGRPRLPTYQSLELLFAAVTNSSVNFVNWEANVFASRTAIASRLSTAVTKRMSAPAEGSTAV